MCRLLGFVCESPTPIGKLAGVGFEDFEKLSFLQHGDGWGIAQFFNNELAFEKSPNSAYGDDEFFSMTRYSKADIGIVHLRWATLDLEISPSNSHPFIDGEVAFCHNGSIFESEKIKDWIDSDQMNLIEGTTDSELIFRLIMTYAKAFPLEQAISRAAEGISQSLSYSSLNSMLVTPDFLYVLSYYDTSQIMNDLPDDYYQLSYQVLQDALVVASSGWVRENAKAIDNRKLMIVERSTMAFRSIPL
ncbi:class II glutamine amidotransferase [Acidithrix ferrooxidans]|uniref:Amidohydrolase EgtC n=1 Tax=Acidithrix ferrooxidans TaxID=1280514 RepID=A0A0D8HIS6_9ACTN|nr:class II glutamine amidotransferase [Acidithrix ferrooxidans]KJF17774.1 amidohydrolase EgtC [Acidithrix ferrooxidans]